MCIRDRLTLVVAQRLGRKVCSECIEDDPDVTKEALLAAGFTEEEVGKYSAKRGSGCDVCSGTGYKGRVAFYEVMKISDDLKEFILNGASTLELGKEAERLGMISLRRAGLMHVMKGNTTFEEVMRVTVGE